MTLSDYLSGIFYGGGTVVQNIDCGDHFKCKDEYVVNNLKVSGEIDNNILKLTVNDRYRDQLVALGIVGFFTTESVLSTKQGELLKKHGLSLPPNISRRFMIAKVISGGVILYGLHRGGVFMDKLSLQKLNIWNF